MRPSRFTSLFSRLAAICMAVAPVSVWANHDLILVFDEGIEECFSTLNTYAVGTDSGGCVINEESSVQSIVSGSYMWVDQDIDSIVDVGELVGLAVGPDGGIWIGHEQIANGGHTGNPTFTENAHIDQPWPLFGGTGMMYTDSVTGQGSIVPGSVMSFSSNPSSGSGLLDFSSWRVNWDTLYHYLGGDVNQGDTGLATITCTPAPCASGSTYTLDYLAHPPPGVPYGLIPFNLHLEGYITTATDITPPLEVNNTGITVENGDSVTISGAELTFTDDFDAAALVSYTLTNVPSNGQLELTTSPGSALTVFTPFTQDDIDNNRLIYVHDGSPTNSDSFDFTVIDSTTNTTPSITFNLVVGLANISVQPQDVRAAVEWLPANLANTPASFTPMQVNLTGDIATNDVIRIDLPGKGLRRTVSDANTGSGTAFVDPRSVIYDAANNRAIVSDQALPGLVAVGGDGSRTVFSQGGVAGNGTAFSSPGRLRLDAANSLIYVSDTLQIITVDLTNGDRTVLSDNSGSFGTGPNFQQVRGVAIDAANNRLLVAEQNVNAILAVDTATGDRTVFSDGANGSGTAFSSLRDAILDTVNNRLLVSDVGLNAIFAVDLSSGDRTVISRFSTSTGAGPDFGAPTHLAVDIPNNRLLISAYQQFAVYAMDLDTGDRTLVSDNSTHAGPAFVRHRGIVLAGWTVALVVDTDAMALLSVSLAPSIGDRTILSNDVVGTGVAHGNVRRGIAVDEDNELIFLSSDSGNALFVYDPFTGARTILSQSPGTGSGPDISSPRDVIVDNARNRILLGNSGPGLGVMAIDRSTGNRSWLANFDGLRGMALDAANNRILVTDTGTVPAVYTVDLDSGVIGTLSSDIVGGGAGTFVDPIGIVVDATGNRALVTDEDQGGTLDRVVGVDLTSGARTDLATYSTFDSLRGITLDRPRNRALVVDITGKKLLGMDLSSPSFVVLSSVTDTAGIGPDFILPHSVVMYRGRALVASGTTGIGEVMAVDLYDPLFGSSLPATPFASSPVFSYSLTGGAGQSFAEWTNTGPQVTGPVTLTFNNMPIELTGAGVDEVVDFTFTLKDSGGNNLKATPVVSGPAFTMVNAITATVTPSFDTLDAGQGSVFFDDSAGDIVASDIFIEIQNNATLNNLGEAELVVRLLGDFTGISKVSASVESEEFRAYTSTSGNFTMLDPNATVFGGTNDVTATWDGTLIESEFEPDFIPGENSTNFNLSIASASNPPFFGFPWTVHHARMFGEGTYTFDSDCTSTDLESGNNTCGDGPYTTLTVGAGQVGAHMLFDWNVSTDIHVAMVWDVGSGGDFESGGSGELYTGGAGSAATGQLYELISRDGNSAGTPGFGIQGVPMVNGPFTGYSLNFNLDLFAGDGVVDEFTVPAGQGEASAFLVGGIAEESTKSFHVHLELDGTTTQTPRDFTARIDVLSSSGIVAPDTGIAGLNGTVAATFDETPDTDGDGLTDDVETSLGTDPNLTDTDGDGISDYDEVNVDTNPGNYTPGTDYDPNNPDTDGDGFLDGGEVQFGSDPLSGASTPDSTIRVSTDSAGIEGNALSYTSVVSADGRYVAFESDAANLVTGDTNAVSDIFIKDTQTGVTTRVSTDTNGVEANAVSNSAAISGDGRYVAFRSQASNLVASDTNGVWDIFVKDTQTGITTRVSTDSVGIQGNNASDKPVISGNGRYVAFSSPATNLVASDNNPTWDVFLKDTQTGITTRVSIDSAELDANGPSDEPAISADGRYVGFHSWSTNLVASDTNGAIDIFIRDTQTGDTTRVSTDGAGLEGNGDSFDHVLSADGRYVAFRSSASNLVSGDLNNKQDVFLKDTQTGVITRASTDSADTEGNNHSLFPALSADGRYLAFSSYASNLVAGGSNVQGDSFVKDMLTGDTVRVNIDSGGALGNSYGIEPAISADGRYVVFYSPASNLVSGDNNGVNDVFRTENSAFIPDTDGDGVRDDVDAFPNDPNESGDFDGDGIGNNADPDNDNDGMPNSFEILYGLDPFDATDAGLDLDGDGYDNESEFRAGTIPDDTGDNPGSVAALHYKLLSQDGAALDAYGWGVDIDGDTALIGASGDDASGGSVYVYVSDGAVGWTLQDKLVPADNEAGDFFGAEVILDGDTALIGASGDDDNGVDAGSAYVFTRSGSVWTQQDKFTGSGVDAGGFFADGGNLALDGDTALVGTAFGNDGAGAVYVFTRSGASWMEQTILTAGDPASGDAFGFGVALDAGIAVIGAGFDDDNGPESGSAYIFTGSGASWTEQTKLTASDGAEADNFAYGAVDIKGDTVLIGAQGAGSGSAYVFKRISVGSWSELSKLVASDASAGDLFGSDVALSGDTALIAASGKSDNGTSAGGAYIFVRDGQDVWSEHQILLAEDGAPDDLFGYWSTLSGDRALVSAPYDDDNGADAGAAYVFELTLPPVANNDTDTVGEGASKVIDLAANDSDANGDLDPASIVIVSPPASAAVPIVVNANGTVFYTHDGSETGSDSFTYTIDDLNGTTSTAATVDITITAVNDLPSIDLDGSVSGINFATTFTEGAGGIAVVDSDASIDDPDASDQIEGATLMISSPTLEDSLTILGGQDALDLINDNIAGVEDRTTITMSGAASPADYLAAIQLVRYDNSSSQPDIPPTRTVTIVVNDGIASSPVAATSITVVSTNSDFIAADDNYVVDEDTSNNYLNVTSNDIDPDGTEPVITSIITPPANGFAVPSGDKHSIIYTPLPNFSGVETIVYEASDGGFSHQATLTITVTDQNDPPALDLDGVAGGSPNYTVAFTEGSGAVALTAGAVITDFDSPDMKTATIAITNPKSGDLLSIQGTATNLPAGITAFEDVNGTYIVLNGSPLAAVASWEQALDLIRYENSLVGPDVTQRSIAFILNDDNNVPNPETRAFVNIQVDDDPPVLDLDADGAGTGYTASFVTGQGSSGVAIVDSDISIVDDGAQITAASVNMTNALSGDALVVGALPAGITAIVTGNVSVSLSGNASAADYQAALAALDYTNTLLVPSLTERVIDISVTDDGSNSSDTATAVVSLQAAPIIDLNGTDAGESFATRFTIDAVAAVAVADTDANVVDADSTSLTQLAITLANPAAGDQLTVDTAQLNLLGIAVDAASTSTYKLLTGTASKASYTLALAYVGFLNTETVPAPAARLIKFVATDTDLHQGLPTVTTVGIGSDFAITFEPLPEIVLADATLTYTINVTNVGTAPATDLVLTSVLDEDAFITGILDPNSAGWDCSDFQSGANPTAVCSLPSLLQGATVSLTVEIMTPAVTKEIINSITVTNNDPLLGTGNASQSNLVVNFLDGTGFLPEEKLTDTDGATDYGDSGADFGSSIVLHDDFLIVGSPDDFDGASDSNGIQSGAVAIYQRTPSGWIQLARLVKPGAHAPGDGFGSSVAWDGNWLVVGSPGVGEVHVFDAAFANPATLAIADGSGTPGSEYGRSVAISNSRIAVGAPRADINGSNNGRVYLFEENAGSWAQAGSVDSDKVSVITGISSNNSDFGAAVALEGDRLVIGAPYENGPVSQGVALLYEHVGASWVYRQALLKPTIDKPDAFGRALDIDGDSIVVGAMFYDSGHPDSGAAHVFSRDASGNWNHDQKLVASNAISSEEFGSSVDLQGDTLLVGAYNGLNPIPNFISGVAYVFQRTGSVWNEQQIVSATDAGLGDRFGLAVAMDGDRIALGTPADDDNGLPNSGSVYIFRIRSNSANKLFAFDRTVDAEFGTTLAVSGDTLVVGAPYHDHVVANDDNKGAAYVYRRVDESWELEQQLLASNAVNDDHFGWSVDISGDRIVVGAPGRDGTFANSGAAYTYTRIGTAWIGQQQLGGQSPAVNDEFGAAVAIDGSRIAVGVPGRAATIMSVPLQDAGVVEVFDFGGIWTYQTTLVATTITTGFGRLLDVEGDIIVAAALNSNAYVFENSSGWTIHSQLSAGVTSVAMFGDQASSALVAGDTIVLGAANDDAVGQIDTGAVNSYRWNGSSWTDIGKLYADDAAANARFGASIALFGDQMLVGAPGDSEAANDAGAAYLYKSVAGDWVQRGKIVTNDAEQDDALGGGSPTAVAINLDGRIVGAYREDVGGSGTNFGSVYTSFTIPGSSLPTGSFSANQLVTLECDDCADIYYTTNGSTPTTSSTRYTGAITIEAVGGLTTTTNLRFIAVDSQGNSSSVQTTSLLIDVEDPTVALDPASPYQNGGLVDTALLPIQGVAADEAGGSGLRQVQLELRDAAGEYVLIDEAGVFQGMTSTQTWLTATTTDGWATWTLPITTVPFVEGGTYSLRVRGYDQTGNVSDFINTGFSYFTGTAAFMTLDLNISASSILNLPGDSPIGEGEIDASVKLTDPSDLGTDLTGSSISLDITDPNGVVTVIPLVTNINGQQTLQDLGDGSLIDFNVEGAWTLQAHYPGTTTRDPAESAPLTLLVGQSAGSAVIVVGRLGGANEGLESHNKTGKRIYDILISRGLQAADIEFYSPDTNRDGSIDPGVDGLDCNDSDGCNDIGGLPNGIDAIPSRANVQAAIEGMAALSNVNPAPRYVFMVDHGSPGEFLLNDAESIMPNDLDLWLDNQESVLVGDALAKPSVVVLGMCYSGSFLLETAVDDGNNSSPVDRVVIASAAENEESYKGTEESDGIRVGEFFLEEFVKEAGRGASLKAAFEYATTQAEIFTRKSDIAIPDPVFNDVAAQHPLLEDNGLFDPVQLAANNLLKSSAGADGALSDKLFLGVGPTYATNAVSNPADITTVTETVFLSAGEDSRLLTLTTNDDTKVASAWIEVRAPATQLTPTGGSIQLDPVLTRSIMNPPVPDILESWFTTYNQFTLSGKYEIFYFVEDATSGEISPIRRSIVYRNTGGNGDPAAPGLLLPDNGATTDNEILFDWSESIDPEDDPVTYTLEISTDDTFVTVDYREEEITNTYTFVGPQAGLQDLTTYHWRVIAVDAFGGKGISSSFSFTTDLTNAVRGVVFATVTNAISDVVLQGATVIAVNDSGGTVAPLETAYMPDGAGGTFYRKYPDGVYDITITNVDGFAPATEEGVDVSVNEQSYATVLPAASADTDGDGIDDSVETANGTNPNSVDTDQDGIVDGAGNAVLIVDYPTGGGYPVPVDTNGDGYVDGELDFDNDPTVADFADGNIGPYPVPDTVLNIADYLVATRIVLGDTPIAADSPQALGHIDMNADGEVNAGDLVLLLKAIQSQ